MLKNALGTIKTGIESKNARHVANMVARKVGQPSIRGVAGRGRSLTAAQVQRRGYRRMAMGGGALALNGMMTRMDKNMGYGTSGSNGLRPRASGGYA